VTSARTRADIGDERKRVLSPSARDICGAVNVPHESEAMRTGAVIGQPQLVFLRVDVRLCALPAERVAKVSFFPAARGIAFRREIECTPSSIR
jgi:hypothetical protein